MAFLRVRIPPGVTLIRRINEADYDRGDIDDCDSIVVYWSADMVEMTKEVNDE